MCPRYEFIPWSHDLARRFQLSFVPPLEDRDEIRPTDLAPAITGDRTIRLLRWGLPAARGGRPMINARAETLSERPTFRRIVERRCLVPATAYFEWRRDGRARLKNRIAPADGRPFAFAGLTDGDHFTIVTCAPAAAIGHIHPRMPVILEESGEAAWIDPVLRFADVRSLLAPWSGRLAVVEETPRDIQPSLF